MHGTALQERHSPTCTEQHCKNGTAQHARHSTARTAQPNMHGTALQERHSPTCTAQHCKNGTAQHARHITARTAQPNMHGTALHSTLQLLTTNLCKLTPKNLNENLFPAQQWNWPLATYVGSGRGLGGGSFTGELASFSVSSVGESNANGSSLKCCRSSSIESLARSAAARCLKPSAKANGRPPKFTRTRTSCIDGEERKQSNKQTNERISKHTETERKWPAPVNQPISTNSGITQLNEPIATSLIGRAQRIRWNRRQISVPDCKANRLRNSLIYSSSRK